MSFLAFSHDGQRPVRSSISWFSKQLLLRQSPLKCSNPAAPVIYSKSTSDSWFMTLDCTPRHCTSSCALAAFSLFVCFIGGGAGIFEGSFFDFCGRLTADINTFSLKASSMLASVAAKPVYASSYPYSYLRYGSGASTLSPRSNAICGTPILFIVFNFLPAMPRCNAALLVSIHLPFGQIIPPPLTVLRGRAGDLDIDRSMGTHMICMIY